MLLFNYVIILMYKLMLKNKTACFYIEISSLCEGASARLTWKCSGLLWCNSSSDRLMGFCGLNLFRGGEKNNSSANRCSRGWEGQMKSNPPILMQMKEDIHQWRDRASQAWPSNLWGQRTDARGERQGWIKTENISDLEEQKSLIKWLLIIILHYFYHMKSL